MSNRICKADGCESTHHKGLGYCGKHYQRVKKYGSPEIPTLPAITCRGPECNRTLDPVQNKTGLCRSHYKQSHLGKALTPLAVATSNLGRPATCEFPGCDRPHKARGLCKSHNDQAVAGKQLAPIKERIDAGPCDATGCEAVWIADGLCARHLYSRKYRWGRYGLTPDQGSDIYRAQDARCAICRVEIPIERMHVDHDHSCCEKGSCGSCVRGLLCGSCNLGLGQFGDDPTRLAAAIQYLNRGSTLPD